MYGFKKVRKCNKISYTNKLFKQGREDDIKKIKRKPVHQHKNMINRKLKANNSLLLSKVIFLKTTIAKKERRHIQERRVLLLENETVKKQLEIEQSKNRWYRNLIIDALRSEFTK